MCVQGGITGTCTLSCTDSGKSYCAFPDPTDCPATGLKFGVLAGESLAGQCTSMCMAIDAGGADGHPVDAAMPDSGTPHDAGPISKEIVVADSQSNNLWVYNAATLSSMGAFPVASSAFDLQSAEVAGATLWVTNSNHDVLAIDPSSLVVRPGWPVHFDPATACTPSAFNADTIFCSKGSTVSAWKGMPPTEIGHYDLPAAIVRVSATETRVFVTYAGGTTLAVLDASTLSPVLGSPITLPFSGIAVGDDALRRLIVIDNPFGAGEVRLFDEDTLSPLGTLSLSTTGVDGAAFDRVGHRVILSIGKKLASYSSDDLAMQSMSADLTASGAVVMLHVDSTRSQIYAIGQPLLCCATQLRMLVLDANTLMDVVGSPLLLPGTFASAVTFW